MHHARARARYFGTCMTSTNQVGYQVVLSGIRLINRYSIRSGTTQYKVFNPVRTSSARHGSLTNFILQPCPAQLQTSTPSCLRRYRRPHVGPAGWPGSGVTAHTVTPTHTRTQRTRVHHPHTHTQRSHRPSSSVSHTPHTKTRSTLP